MSAPLPSELSPTTPPRPRAPAAEQRIASGDKRLEWVPVSKMRVSPRAQRDHSTRSSRAKIEDISANFDPDIFGTQTVNLRDDIYWVIDGGHRYHALLMMGWEDQSIQCWTYHGLTEAEEADKFLSLNDVKTVSSMDKFHKALVAKRPTETDIDRIVRAADLSIGKGRDAIGCVGAVSKIYESGGGRVLSTTMRVIRDAYGVPGFSAKVTEGTGLFVANYENTFDEVLLVERLGAKKGGVNGLIGEAERIKKKYGVALAVGVAAAVVETYNQGRGGNKLNGWWSTFNGDTEAES
jgi:hypothetical protein